MHTILSSRPSSYRLTILGVLLVSLVIATVVVGLATSRAVASSPQPATRTVAAAVAYTRYADMKERQAEQRDSLGVARAASITALAAHERYLAIKEQQAERRDNSAVALVAAAPSAPHERYLAMKERQAEAR
ncbi:MAG: hypothetical protein U0641_19630 [Anaerolineae bacterium]